VDSQDSGASDAGVDGGRSDACVPRAEVCNGRDDDCDGVADDGVACFSLDGVPVTALETTRCGADWYSYDAPDSQSANPSPDIRVADGVVVAFQYGPSCAGASVAVIADLAADGTGGELRASFALTPADSARVLVSDEDHECVFDEASGSGVCDFAWVGCCTDGVLIGPLTEGCVTLTLEGQIGLESLAFIDGSGARNERAFGASMLLCVQILPEA